MPLYMDFHKIDNVTVEDVKVAHIADKAIQDKYGVRYHQFWVNQEAGTVFCLMEGPDAATCELVHQLAHGNVACALTEVEPGFYEKMMGSGHRIDQGHVQHKNGLIDNGYRTIIVFAIIGKTKAEHSKDLQQFQKPEWARDIVYSNIANHNGREILWEIDDSIIAAFDDVSQAISCAFQTQLQLEQDKNLQPGIVFRIGASASQPVTADGDFFQESIKLAHRLCMIAESGQVITSSLVAKLCVHNQLFKNNYPVKSLKLNEEEFFSNLVNITEEKIGDERFDLNELCAAVSVSRPQLYRKIMSLTGLSPNDFVRHLRLTKALTMLKQQRMNIAEIAYETGFSSPSYFSKCFTEKFGCAPSAFLKISS